MNTLQKIQGLNWAKITQEVSKVLDTQKQSEDNFIKLVQLKNNEIVVKINHNWGVKTYTIPFNCNGIYVTLNGSIFN